jgi:hypothetical protein
MVQDSGTGSGQMVFDVAANTTINPRTGTISMEGETFTVNQAGLECTYSLNPTSIVVTGTGGAGFTVDITALAGCDWSATSNDSWITITGDSNGSGSDTVTYTVDYNGSESSRSGSMTIAGITFPVTQNGVPCTYDFDPDPLNVSDTGGTYTIDVTTPAHCPWEVSITEGGTWITDFSPTGEQFGDGTVTFTILENLDASGRTGKASIGGVEYTINQDGAECVYSIDPTSATHGPDKETGTVDVTVTTGCEWTAESNDTWITVTGGASGSGNGTVTYEVARNPKVKERTGTMTIAGQTFDVTQDPQRVRILWNHPNGDAIIWILNQGQTTYEDFAQFGPYNTEKYTYMARSYHMDNDGKERILWSRNDGMAVLWTLNEAGTAAESFKTYGPYPQWVPVSYHQDENGVRRILWTSKDPGVAVLWKLKADQSGPEENVDIYEVGNPNWHAITFGQDDDGTFRIGWTNVGGGQAVLWEMESDLSTFSSFKHYVSEQPGWVFTSYWQNPITLERYLVWTQGPPGYTVRWTLTSDMSTYEALHLFDSVVDNYAGFSYGN